MQLLTDAETARLLPFGPLTEHLSDMLRDRRAGTAQSLDRLHLPLPMEGQLLVMPATDARTAITKLVSVHPHNSHLGLPTIQGEVVVIDATNGERLLLLHGETVTARRTAALSMLAAKLLAPTLAGPLLIVGAGVQARAHLEAAVELLGIREVYVLSRSRQRAVDLAQYGQQLGTACAVVNDPRSVLGQVHLIVTATTSTTPVLPAEVPETTFIAAVGAYRADAAEVAPDLVRRARLYVDSMAGARKEAGDFIQAGIDWGTVTPLECALDDQRPTAGPIIFKSVGDALWDLAAARLATGRGVSRHDSEVGRGKSEARSGLGGGGLS